MVWPHLVWKEELALLWRMQQQHQQQRQQHTEGKKTIIVHCACIFFRILLPPLRVFRLAPLRIAILNEPQCFKKRS